MKCFNDPAIQCLMERGGIPRLDATILVMFCFYKEIHSAILSATVWELRDRTLISLRDTLIERFPLEEKVKAQTEA